VGALQRCNNDLEHAVAICHDDMIGEAQNAKSFAL